MIRVAIVEPFTLLREALQITLSGSEQVQVVGEAGSGAEAVELVKRAQPDVLLLETSMPNKDGIDTTKDVLRLATSTKVLVLSSDTVPHHASRMLRAGARGFLPKTVRTDEVVQAIHAVHRGQVYIHEDLQKTFAEWHVRPHASSQPEEQLSDREYQVMRMLALGATNREIGKDLSISVKTVDTHRANLLKKLGLRNNSDITRFAIRNGFVSA